MNSKLSYRFLLLFMTAAVCTSVITGCGAKAKPVESADIDKDNVLSIPALMERKGQLANAAEWPKTREKVNELVQKIGQQNGDVKSRLQVATIYIAEARITGQHGYYDPAVLHILDGVLVLDANNFEAYVYKALVKMSQHQFTEALSLAEKARTINPDNAYVYGMLTDANVELGNYSKAIEMSDKMQALKPSLESYSRASYLREIHGDYKGAITAMKMAVEAGVPGSESAEWARVALGDLYLNTGKPDSAAWQYRTSLELRPDFPNAEIGLAKVEKAKKNYDSAISHVEKAIRIVSEAPYVSMLGQLYLAKGDKEKSTGIFNDVVDLLEKAEKEQAGSVSAHNGNRELAMAYLDACNYDKAMEYAKKDLAMRPDNIDANELAGWIAFKKGDFKTAGEYVQKMLVTNTMNAVTLYRAAMISRATGDNAGYETMMKRSRSVNGYLDETLLLAVK